MDGIAVSCVQLSCRTLHTPDYTCTPCHLDTHHTKQMLATDVLVQKSFYNEIRCTDLALLGFLLSQALGSTATPSHCAGAE